MEKGRGQHCLVQCMDELWIVVAVVMKLVKCEDYQTRHRFVRQVVKNL